MRRKTTLLGTAGALRAMPSLARLDDREIRSLADAGREVGHPTGTLVVREGEMGIGFHVILEGTADVIADGVTIASLGAGEYFGEIGLMENKARTATVVATSELRCLTVVSWAFRPMLERNPGLNEALLEGLARRLRTMLS